MDNADLQVKRGTFFGFLSPNGTSKITAFKMLTGMLAFPTTVAQIGCEPKTRVILSADVKLKKHRRDTRGAYLWSEPSHQIPWEEISRLRPPQCCGLALVPVWWFDTHQIAHEEILHFAFAVSAAHAVTAIWDDQQIKIFSCANQRIHKSHC